jgi:putative ATP-dependent endonuclease of OLD family
MQVSRLTIEHFRGIDKAVLHFTGHTLLIGVNNVGKSTICEALDLVLGPDRLNRTPPVEEFDFRNARYFDADNQQPIPIRIEVVLTGLSETTQRLCGANLEFWHRDDRRVLTEGEIDATNQSAVDWCLRLTTIAEYDPEDDQFSARTVYASTINEEGREPLSVPGKVKRAIGFLYLRTLRTGSKALSLERGSLLDTILRLKEVRSGMWESIRARLVGLEPPVDSDASELRPVLDEIEARLDEYVSTGGEERSSRLFVSQLTREHLRKTIAFFLTMCEGESPVPFYEAGTGTLNSLVLALLTFIAEIKKDDVIFAMEEPEIALPPHTQRRIVNYLLKETTQCFVTSHSPYVIERFSPEGIVRLTRDASGVLTALPISLPEGMKTKTYRSQLRRSIAEAILGRGAIVGEGVTEQTMLAAAAQMMEEADSNLYPLDLAGISIINTEGDGNLEAMGNFFETVGIPAFAFFDRKKRDADELARITASFTVATEIPYKGAEGLLAAEVPLDRQWQFLTEVRSGDDDGKFVIPGERPDDDKLRQLTVQVLKGLKGDAGAAKLLAHCSIDECPVTIRTFLKNVYERFPRPKKKGPASQTAPAADVTAQPEEFAQAEPAVSEEPGVQVR